MTSDSSSATRVARLVRGKDHPGSRDIIEISLLDLVPPRNRFVINLDRRPDRRRRYERQFAAANIEPIRVSAVDARSLPPEHPRGASPFSRRRCSMAEMACSQSHRELWQLGALRDEPLMIFEDDVYFCDDVGEHLRRPLELPRDFGIFYLGAAWREDIETYAAPGIYELHGCRTLHAYVISPTACRQLLLLAGAIPALASDHYTLMAHRTRLVRAHIALPLWAVQTGDASDIALRMPIAASFGTLFESVLPSARWPFQEMPT